MHCRPLITIVFIMCSCLVEAEEIPDTTIYNCDVAETINFIEQSTPAFFLPTAIPTTSEIKAAHIAAKQAAGGEACLSILTDGTFSDEWKTLVETIRNSDFSFPSFDPELGSLYEIMKRTVEEQVAGALEDLGADICRFMSKASLERIALRAINRKTGIRARELTINGFANSIEDLVFHNSNENVQRLMSKNKMKRDVRNETLIKTRELRRDLWDNL